MSLALNYEPEVVVNIETLTREEWLDYRRLGIGGSDVAAIMGISPFARASISFRFIFIVFSSLKFDK